MYKIIRSKISNRGLVASKDIKKKNRIIEYKGRLISKKKLKQIRNLIMINIFTYLILIRNMTLMEIISTTPLGWSIILAALIVR